MDDAPRVVDVHAHLMVREVQPLVQDHPGPGASRALEARRNGPTSVAVTSKMFAECLPQLTDLDRRIVDMDTAGVDVQLLSVFPGQFAYYAEPELALTICRTVARGIAAAVADKPERFTGLGLVPLQHPQLCVEALDDARWHRGCSESRSRPTRPDPTPARSNSATPPSNRSGSARPRPEP